MAIRQLLSLRDFIPNSLGNPAREHYVHILEPGTTTQVTSYSDGTLQNANPNPVPLSASGKASIWVSRDIDVLITQGPLLTDPVLADEKNANPEVAGATSSGLVPNGSFENDTDADDVPDGWTEVAEVGSNNGIDTSVSSDGLQSFRFTSVGTGGGSLTTTDFFAVNDTDDLRVNFDIRSSVVDVRNIVRVEWYDISQVPISNTDVYDNAVSNPTSFTPQALVATPPAGARFAKLRLIGCDPSDVTPGSTWYDRVNVFYPLVVSGVFDNITIQNNEIVSTNTDGRIQLRPDGAGGVDVTSDDAVDLTDANNPLNVGTVDDPSTNSHIALDASQIQAKADATNAAGLTLNPFGGAVAVGNAGSGGGQSLILDAAATFDTVIALQENSVEQFRVSHDASEDQVRMRLANAGDTLQIEEGAGVNIAAVFTPNADQILRAANNARLAVNDNGIEVLGSQDISPNALGEGQISIEGNGYQGFIALDATALYIGQNSGSRALVLQTNEVDHLEITGGGTVTLKHGATGADALLTTSAGVDVLASGGGSNVTDLISDNAGGSSNLGLRTLSNGARVRVLEAAGTFTITQTNAAGGVENTWIEALRDGRVTLLDNDVAAARTLPVASGGFEVDNQLTGGGFERVLTTSDLPQGAVKDAPTTRSVVSLVADPDLSGFPLQPSTQYVVEAMIVCDGQGATTQDMDWAFDFNGQIANVETVNGSVFYYHEDDTAHEIFTDDAGFPSGAVDFGEGSAGQDFFLHIMVGIVTQADFVAGTDLDFQWSPDAATSTRVDEGSWMRVTKVA